MKHGVCKKVVVVKRMLSLELNFRCQIDLIKLQSHRDSEYKFITVCKLEQAMKKELHVQVTHKNITYKVIMLFFKQSQLKHRLHKKGIVMKTTVVLN